MPLLRKDLMEKSTEPALLRDNDQVFYCESTKEIFKNYEDYFRRIMLLSSTVWVCSITGKPGLTFDEAEESEKKAKRLLKSFPTQLKSPVVMVAKHTKRSAISELVDDVYNYIMEHIFRDEEINQINADGKIKNFVKILDVILPEKKKDSPVKKNELKFSVENLEKDVGRVWVCGGENLRRPRYSITKDLCKLFLKQHVEQESGMLKIKDASYKKFITDKHITLNDIFYGKPPDFEKSKKLVLMQEASQGKKKAKKKSPTAATAAKQNAKGGKQQTMEKFLNNKSSESGGTAATAKSSSTAKSAADEKSLKEEMERKRQEKLKQEAERKEAEKEKARIEKLEVAKKIEEAFKKYMTVHEDQELQDQREIPQGRPVSALIGNGHYFSDFVQTLEFMTSFAELLSIKDKFPHGVTMETFERALMCREVNGPLSDIFQVLLSTIFTLQIDEESEVIIQYDSLAEFQQKRGGVPMLRRAADNGSWVNEHYSMRLNELPIDSTTISELLRLHFLTSGSLIADQGARWRFQQRGGYQSCDDPGLALVTEYPHILKALNLYSVFSLPKTDILKILKCLVDQLMTYSSVRDLIEERIEKMRAAKMQYIAAELAKRKRISKVNSDKFVLRETIRKQLSTFEGTAADKAKLKIELNEQMEKDYLKIDADLERDMKNIVKDIEICKENYFDYQIYLGMDRAFRSYWMFESLPGLFVEHDMSFAGKCYDESVTHIPGLATVSEAERRKFITNVVTAGLSDDKENKIEKMLLNYKPPGNGLIEKNIILNGETVKKDEEEKETVRGDLLMCTADRKTCPVHNPTFIEGKTWSFYSTEAEIKALIESLNPRGIREKVLRDNLLMEKELILKHIEMCPVEKITIDPKEKEIILDAILQKKTKQYENANLNHPAGTDTNEILDAILRENLLEFENKMAIGYLGDAKVTDRMAWRTKIFNFEYETFSKTPLVWGRKRLLAENGEENSDIEADNENNNLPGYDLGGTNAMESEDSQDELIYNYDSESSRKTVLDLASALLQLEQGLDPKFLLYPFGGKKNAKSKTVMEAAIKEGRENVAKWEESLMKSTSFAQVFLHYNVLFDLVHWQRSVANLGCMICRRKRDADQTLLCDDCNRACHMYCLKPALKKVPEGDWFCPKCRPEAYIVEKTKKKRKIFVEEKVEEEEDEEIEYGRDIMDETLVESDGGDEEKVAKKKFGKNKCKICNDNDASAKCNKCNSFYHTYCTESLQKTPTKKWICDRCREKKPKKGFSLKINGNTNENEDFEDDIGDDEEIIVEKKAKKGRKSKNLEDEEEEEDEVPKKKGKKSKNSEEEVEKRPGRRSKKHEEVEEMNWHVNGETEEEIVPKKKARKSLKYVEEDEIEDEDDEDEDDEEEEEAPRKKRASSKRKSSLANGEESKKRGRRSSRKSYQDEAEESIKQKKRSRSSKTTYFDDDYNDETDDEPLSKRRSKAISSSPEESSARRAKRSGDDLPLHSVNLYKLLDDIIKHQDSWPFNRPVSVKEVPDYYDIIKNPMDFAKIKSKLNMGQYSTNFDVMDDIQLVFMNCDLYNTDETEVYSTGLRLEKYVEKRCRELCLPFKSSDMLKESSKK